MPTKLSRLRDRLLYQSRLNDICIYAFYLIVLVTLIVSVEITMHSLNKEIFLAWMCADVRGAMAFIIPVNDERLAFIEKISDKKKRHVVTVFKEILTVVFVAIASYNITNWILGHEAHHTFWWWVLDISIIILLWVGHYFLVECFVKRHEAQATMISSKYED